MGNELLQTKLFIPPIRPNLVPRPHLVEKLKRKFDLGSKVTLLSAPAGFGKLGVNSRREAVSQARVPTFYLILINPQFIFPD